MTDIVGSPSQNKQFTQRLINRGGWGMTRKSILVAVVAVGMLLAVGNLEAASQVQKTFTVPASFAGTITATECSAVPGPQVTVQGSVMLPGLKAEVIFTDPSEAPAHGQSTPVTQVVVAENQAAVLREQSVRGPVTNNPYIWLQLTDEHGKPLSSEIFLGRCDQAQFQAAATLDVPMKTVADVSANACQ